MRKFRSAVVVLGVVSAAMVVAAQPATAAPPSNDTPDGATPITALPFTDDIDTSEATTDQAELDAIAPCLGVPAVERAVWYVAQVTTDAALVRTDVTASDYSAGIAVFIGEPTAAGFALCGPGIISGPVSGGQTVYVMVFGDTAGDPGRGCDCRSRPSSCPPSPSRSIPWRTSTPALASPRCRARSRAPATPRSSTSRGRCGSAPVGCSCRARSSPRCRRRCATARRSRGRPR